mmetsp:Transcript_33153/g.30075  ORF Transcript_33153/g.30075 Transcript_33153/m.30075 type:complete len:96 (-) Transcript_33153:664-951(-)
MSIEPHIKNYSLLKENEYFNSKFYECIGLVINYVVFTKIMLLSQNKEDYWKAALRSYEQTQSSNIEEEEYLDQMLVIFGDKNLNLINIINAKEGL